MANYLMTKYKGTYRILPEIDRNTNDFPRDENGNYDEDEIYIACQNGNKISFWGLNDSRRGVLLGYVPSLGRGRNIKKAMKKEKIQFFDYDESDEEVMFKFPATEIEIVAQLMKAKTGGANISPFSSRNLPKTDIEIPLEEIAKYKAVSSKVNKNDLLLIKNINAAFLSDILEKTLRKQYKDKTFSCKDDMRKLMMSRQVKEYIWTKGLWQEYIDYLDEEIDKFYNNN